MAVSIGVFDGVHRGHQELLSGLVAQARDLADLRAAVVTFDTHPRSLLTPERAPRTLMSVNRRIEVLESLGVDQVGILPFAQIQHLPPDEFVRRVVVNGFNARLVIVGRGFRYGAGRAGKVTSLRESGERNGFTVGTRHLLRSGSVPISSSMIRACIAQGDVATAGDLLGRPHELSARRVTGGFGRSEFGTVTTDLGFAPVMAVPAPGSYAARIVIGGNTYPGLCLIESRKESDTSAIPAQVHVLDRRLPSGTGDTLTVRFVEQVRVRGLDAGPTVLEQDILRVRRLLGSN